MTSIPINANAFGHTLQTAPNGPHDGGTPEPRLGDPDVADTVLTAAGDVADDNITQVLAKPSGFGTEILIGRIQSCNGTFQGVIVAQGTKKQIDDLIDSAEVDPLFPKERPPFRSSEASDSSVGCKRYEVYVEADNARLISYIPYFAAQCGLAIPTLEIRLLPKADAPDNNANSPRFGGEFLIDVRSDQAPMFGQFKMDLVLLHRCYQSLRIWDPIPEGEAGVRPVWFASQRLIYRQR